MAEPCQTRGAPANGRGVVVVGSVSAGRNFPDQVTFSSVQSRRSSPYFLREQLPLIVQVQAEERVLQHLVALPDHEFQPAAAELVDRGVVLRHPHRIQHGEHGHAALQPDGAGHRGDGCQHGGGGGGDEFAGMPFPDGEAVEAEFLGALCGPDHLVEPVGGGDDLPGHRVFHVGNDVQDLEFHLLGPEVCLIDGLGLGEGFLGKAPALEDLGVGAVLDGGVQRVGDGGRQAVALEGGGGHEGFGRPAGVDLAHDLEVIAGVLAVGHGRERGDVQVGAAGRQRQDGVGVGGVVLQDRGSLALGLQFLVPGDQDLLLVGAGAHGDFQAGDIVRALDVVGGALLGLEAHVGGPVAGEVEELHAGCVDADVGEHGLEIAGLGLQRPVLPGRHLDVQFQAQFVRDQLGDVQLDADRGLVVGGVEGQRDGAGGGGHCQLAVLVDQLGDVRGQGGVFFRADALLVR